MEQILDFVANHPILFAALGAVLALIVWTELQRVGRGYGELSPSEAVQLMNHRDDALVLDVREDNEVRQGRIQKSKHIPVGVLPKRVEELRKYKDKPVIAYCRSGQRSASACNTLVKNEFSEVYNLKGGLNAWEQENLPVSRK